MHTTIRLFAVPTIALLASACAVGTTYNVGVSDVSRDSVKIRSTYSTDALTIVTPPHDAKEAARQANLACNSYRKKALALSYYDSPFKAGCGGWCTVYTRVYLYSCIGPDPETYTP